MRRWEGQWQGSYPWNDDNCLTGEHSGPRSLTDLVEVLDQQDLAVDHEHHDQEGTCTQEQEPCSAHCAQPMHPRQTAAQAASASASCHRPLLARRSCTYPCAAPAGHRSAAACACGTAQAGGGTQRQVGWGRQNACDTDAVGTACSEAGFGQSGAAAESSTTMCGLLGQPHLANDALACGVGQQAVELLEALQGCRGCGCRGWCVWDGGGGSLDIATHGRIRYCNLHHSTAQHQQSEAQHSTGKHTRRGTLSPAGSRPPAPCGSQCCRPCPHPRSCRSGGS